MVIYNVRIRERVLTLVSKTNNITVGGNKGDQVVFDFDSEWGESYEKVAVFVWNGKYHSVKFTGTTCEAPPIYESNNFRLGVYIGDDMEDEPYLSSTTIVIPCSFSVRDFATNPQDSMNKNFVNRAEAAAVRAEKAADRVESVWELIERICKITFTDDGEGNVKMSSLFGLSLADDGKGNVNTNIDLNVVDDGNGNINIGV